MYPNGKNDACPGRERLRLEVFYFLFFVNAISCMLNQTNIKNNNNKFYTAQILEADKKGQWWLWTRWGRVGNRGQSKLEPCTSVAGMKARVSVFTGVDAKGKFCKKFTEKTGNSWDNRTSFKTYPGKYTIISIDYGSDDDDQDANADVCVAAFPSNDLQGSDSDADVPDSELEPEVQKLIKLICNTESQKQAMIEMKFDLKKMPLGTLLPQSH